MKSAKEDSLRDDFRKLLYELALDNELVSSDSRRFSVYKRLESIYVEIEPGKAFRHYYSDIFSVLSDVHQEVSKGDINNIGINLGIIKNKYNPQDKNCKKDVSDYIKKLYDHVNLEIARINFADKGNWQLQQTEAISKIVIDVNSLKEQVEATGQSVKKTKEEITETQASIEETKNVVEKSEIEIKQTEKEIIDSQNKIENELNRQQREYISILGIFAAIVLAFTTGIAFSTSVLEHINAVSSYRVIFIVLIIGLVITNALFGLFYYIDRLVIGPKPKTLKPLWITNGIMLTLMLLTLLAWLFGLEEWRNARIRDYEKIEEIVVEEQTEELLDEVDFNEQEGMN